MMTNLTAVATTMSNENWLISSEKILKNLKNLLNMESHQQSGQSYKPVSVIVQKY